MIAEIARVEGTSDASADGFDTSANPKDTSAANLLVAALTGASGANALSDSYLNTWHLAAEMSAFLEAAIYYAYEPIVGPGHVFAYSGTDIFGNLQVLAFSGALLVGDPLNKTNQNLAFGATTVQPGAVSPDDDNQLIVTMLNHGTTTQPTINLGFSSPYGQPQSGFGHVGGAVSYLIQGPKASVNPTWTSASGNLYSPIATFKAQPGGASGRARLVGGKLVGGILIGA